MRHGFSRLEPLDLIQTNKLSYHLGRLEESEEKSTKQARGHLENGKSPVDAE